MAKPSKGTPAVALLEAGGTSFALHTYGYAGRPGGVGLEAAQALGVDADRVFKTLIVDVEGAGLAAAILPVALELDLKRLAQVLGHKRALMADVRRAERATGYVKGGISPFGQKQRLPTVLDARAGDASTIFVSGGRRGLEIEVAPADLVALLGATVAPIAR
ncbi:MAG: Cys-tRNA(Pro) deacylase [Geminicoccaceae bacterium]|nr:Cys-tRNA(Pro) deacylase [Geminicoccaceae bacterium]